MRSSLHRPVNAAWWRQKMRLNSMLLDQPLAPPKSFWRGSPRPIRKSAMLARRFWTPQDSIANCWRFIVPIQIAPRCLPPTLIGSYGPAVRLCGSVAARTATALPAENSRPLKPSLPVRATTRLCRLADSTSRASLGRETGRASLATWLRPEPSPHREPNYIPRVPAGRCAKISSRKSNPRSFHSRRSARGPSRGR